MYFEDLTPYVYSTSHRNNLCDAIADDEVNVGWLDIQYPFAQGELSGEFIRRLAFL